MASYLVKNESETKQVAFALAKTLSAGDILAFRGGMGVGKTTFTRFLAEGLGIDQTEVSSPTFSLVHEYRGKDIALIHFDMYRIDGYEPLFTTGYFDYLDQADSCQTILVIEWSENITEFLPREVITVSFTSLGENHRNISIEGGQQ